MQIVPLNNLMCYLSSSFLHLYILYILTVQACCDVTRTTYTSLQFCICFFWSQYDLDSHGCWIRKRRTIFSFLSDLKCTFQWAGSPSHPGFPLPATPPKLISVSIREDYAKILRGITLGTHSHLLTPPHHILGQSTLCSLSAYQLLRCSVQSIPQSCFTTNVTPSLTGTCGRSP